MEKKKSEWSIFRKHPESVLNDIMLLSSIFVIPFTGRSFGLVISPQRRDDMTAGGRVKLTLFRFSVGFRYPLR